MYRRLSVLLLAAALGTALACSSNQKGPDHVAPSSGQAGYAERYPDALAATRGKLSERESAARQMMGSFSGYPDALDKPAWAEVETVYALADDAGKSSAYVERARETETVMDFFTDEKEEISKKVAGAAAYAAKQKGCQDVEAYGPASNALEKSVEKQLEKRLREHNEAHRYIEAHEETLGKQNREKLEEQADDLSYTSYLVHVAVIDDKQKLERMISEGAEIKKTLDRVIEENKAIAADAAKPESVKKSAQAEVDRAESAKAKVDSEVEQAEQAMKEIDQRIKTLKEEYDKALGDLKTKVGEKKSAEGAKS